MTEEQGQTPTRRPYAGPPVGGRDQPASLADILERILDKGIIIAGDIRVNLLDIELLTIKLRLLIVSVDKAAEMGIDWWRHDPMLTVRERGMEEENRALKERIAQLEGGSLEGGSDEDGTDDSAAEDEKPERSSSRGRASSG